ncbi:hypothetical protein C9374_012514 [Naegleria lovaniensis]|uniref:Uncharacterized protein n=1 Tax=Naegleria lovaniensis TaxID=51637 RepID=A0AA88H2Y9_NAELO|nr:uncharacterized protein C9374_012514 [Naegleria lovaniensis]KAG2392262.1 hypothetical protein C9374_012514 [Naegleria lovaniensis]
MALLLRLAEHCGCYHDNTDKNREDEPALLDQVNESSSVDLPHLLAESMNIQDRIFHLHEKYELMSEYSRSFDLLNDASLSERLQILNELCDSLQHFALNKSKILSKIQAPSLDHSQKLLAMNRQYQDKFVKLLKNIARTMDIIHQSLNDLEWASVKKKSIENQKLEEDVFKAIPLLLSKYQRFVSTTSSQTRLKNMSSQITYQLQ